MSEQVGALGERLLHRAISPLIILDGEDEESIQQQIRQGMQIEAATRRIVNGEASIWEALELLENYGHNVDQWASEIETNLSHGLLRLQRG